MGPSFSLLLMRKRLSSGQKWFLRPYFPLIRGMFVFRSGLRFLFRDACSGPMCESVLKVCQNLPKCKIYPPRVGLAGLVFQLTKPCKRGSLLASIGSPSSPGRWKRGLWRGGLEVVRRVWGAPEAVRGGGRGERGAGGRPHCKPESSLT